MTKRIAIVLALGCLSLGAAACNGDDKPAAKSTSAAPQAGAPTSDASAPTAPSATALPTTSTPSAPRATKDPKISGSQVIMIDPEGKRYTRQWVVTMASGMRTTMGKNPPSNFCARSYKEGVAGGGKFPAGRGAFISACEEGWALGG